MDIPGKKSLINIYQSKPVGRPREVGNALNIDWNVFLSDKY